MAAQTHIKDVPERMRSSVVGILIATVVLMSAATFFAAKQYFLRLETDAASNQMALYLRALNETLNQHQHLPFVLARDPRYSDAFQPTSLDPDINERLSQLSHEAGLEAIYVMDQSGAVLAASNAGQPNGFLGQNYGFRPYFQEALAGARSDYFAIGATSGRPGYFVAEPVTFASGTQNGVIAIKLDIGELQRSWESDTERVIAVNTNNIIVLASKQDWLYRPIDDLDATVRDSILTSRQFGDEPLTPLAWRHSSDGRVTVEGETYILAQGQANWRGWRVLYLRSEAIVTRQTLFATGFFGSMIALLVGFATFLRSRRIELAYEASERQRAALTQTNEQLEQAQSELARSAKLAALGHLAASVTHELGQPISAFRNHLAAAEIGGEITSPTTASSLNKLVERMEAITSQFKYFARGKSDTKTDVQLSSVLNESANLLKAEMKNGGITLIMNNSPGPVLLHANKIQLEQAFTNLLKNAVHALEETVDPRIEINVKTRDQFVDIHVQDNGPGLDGASLNDLQEPFFSTKPSGVGMGLGLAITTEIVKDHGGTLALSDQDKGAAFVVSLPLKSSGDLA